MINRCCGRTRLRRFELKMSLGGGGGGVGVLYYISFLVFHEEIFPWWRHQMETFPALLAVCAGNSPVTGDLPHKGQWRGALMFSLICAWVNNRDVYDLRRHHAHSDVTVMGTKKCKEMQIGYQFPARSGCKEYRWLSGRLQCLQCVSNGDTAVLQEAIDIVPSFHAAMILKVPFFPLVGQV